jgi:hypothetical protein
MKEAQKLLDQYQSIWKPIEFQVKEIYINFRTSETDPFLPRVVIPLGQNETDPFIEPVDL